MKTPLKDLNPTEATVRLTQTIQQAYHRRSRQLPANLTDIVATLKGDLLKAYPDCPIETIDEAITSETLHNPDTQLSPTFFFNAVKKAWFTPKTNRHQWDEEDNRRPDTELDTISLLDTCADMLARMDEAEANGKTVIRKSEFKGVVIELPAFNSRREYGYLVMRRQLALNDTDQYFDQALTDINAERLASRHHRLTREEAAKDPDVLARQKRLAVIGWLRRCNTEGTTPSAVLTPLADELQYRQLRRTTP